MMGIDYEEVPDFLLKPRERSHSRGSYKSKKSREKKRRLADSVSDTSEISNFKMYIKDGDYNLDEEDVKQRERLSPNGNKQKHSKEMSKSHLVKGKSYSNEEWIRKSEMNHRNRHKQELSIFQERSEKSYRERKEEQKKKKNNYNDDYNITPVFQKKANNGKQTLKVDEYSSEEEEIEEQIVEAGQINSDDLKNIEHWNEQMQDRVSENKDEGVSNLMKNSQCTKEDSTCNMYIKQPIFNITEISRASQEDEHSRNNNERPNKTFIEEHQIQEILDGEIKTPQKVLQINNLNNNKPQVQSSQVIETNGWSFNDLKNMVETLAKQNEQLKNQNHQIEEEKGKLVKNNNLLVEENGQLKLTNEQISSEIELMKEESKSHIQNEKESLEVNILDIDTQLKTAISELNIQKSKFKKILQNQLF